MVRGAARWFAARSSARPGREAKPLSAHEVLETWSPTACVWRAVGALAVWHGLPQVRRASGAARRTVGIIVVSISRNRAARAADGLDN
jgi:hypothetical protein